MSIFETDQPEFEPWSATQFFEATCFLNDLRELADSRGIDADDAIAYYADRTNGMDFDKWCNGVALKYDRIEKGGK